MNIFLSSKYTQKVGTDALVCPPEHSQFKAFQVPLKAPPSLTVRGGVPNEVLQQA